jgi:hypothetical protein
VIVGRLHALETQEGEELVPVLHHHAVTQSLGQFMLQRLTGKARQLALQEWDHLPGLGTAEFPLLQSLTQLTHAQSERLELLAELD